MPKGARILVDWNDAALAELLRFNLNHESCVMVLLFADGEEAARLPRDSPPRLATLDWRLSARPGLKLCRGIRACPATADMPAVIPTARTAALAELLRFNLNHEGCVMALCADGKEAARLPRDSPPRLAMLGWILPTRLGLKLCRDIRASRATADMPVMIPTARSALEDWLRGFEAGAGDYVGKPLEMSELVSRVKALLRRAEGHPAGAWMELGVITLDPVRRRMRSGERAGSLVPKECGILERLMRAPGGVFSREELLDAVWYPNRTSTSERWTSMSTASGRHWGRMEEAG